MGLQPNYLNNFGEYMCLCFYKLLREASAKESVLVTYSIF